jgi:RNase H-like domain found in reverse transcriptase/Reverse transcriptase (RNA-dependent DNA polymerase)
MSQPLKEVQRLSPSDCGTRGIGSTGVNIVRQDLKKSMDIKHQDFSDEKHAYHLGTKLTPQQGKQIRQLMKQYEDVLAVKFEEIRGARTHYKHVIDTGDHKPIKQAPYRLAPHYKQWVQEEIQQMLKSGIIRPSNSPWSSPIVIVPKKDGQGGFAPRMCVDYRKLNAVTKLDAYPIPRISDILEYMPSEVEYFSTYDMFMGYNQVGMEEDAIAKSAFATPDGHYEFLRMPFGPTNAPATFQRAMNEVFGDMIGKGLYVYIDDVTLYSTTFAEHMALMKEFLSRLRRFRFYIKPKKCTIATHEVELLGHLVTREGIKPSPSKVKAVADYPRPTSKTELRAFLGLIGYYRNFVHGCSRIMEPLSRLLQEHVPFKWDKKGIEEETFIKIKRILIDPDNLLIRPDFNKTFILKTDASALGFGAVLSQMVDKTERPIAYASRRTTRTEANYGSSQMEIAAALYGIEHFKHYLEGAPFRLVTDHSPLLQLIKLKDPKGMVARYIMRLQPYDIDLVIRPGRKHSDADALSRIPHRPIHHVPYYLQRLPKHKSLMRE